MQPLKANLLSPGINFTELRKELELFDMVRDGFQAGIMDQIERLQAERETLLHEQDRISAGMDECVGLCKQELEGLIPQ